MPEQDGPETRCNGPGRKRFALKKLCVPLVVVVGVLVLLLFYVAHRYQTPDLVELLMRAKLAKLPVSIKNLQVDTRPVVRNGRAVPNERMLFVRFQAEPNDIDDFIANSPSIDSDGFHPLSLHPFPKSDSSPTWWPTDQSQSGRVYLYAIQEDIYGVVAVYDDSNTVRIGAKYKVDPGIRDGQGFLENLEDDFEEFVEDLYDAVEDALRY